MKTVILVSYYFPPLNSIAARRFGHMIQTMEKAGYRFIVVTTGSTGDLPVPLPEERIIRICKHWQSAQKLTSHKETFTLPRPLITLKDRFLGENFYLRSFDRSMFGWYKRALKELRRQKERFQEAQLVIGTYGPAADLWLAKKIARWINKPWVADFRDLAALLPQDRSFGTQWLDKKIEKILLKDCSALITVSNTLAETLQNQYQLPVKVIYNGWNVDSYKNLTPFQAKRPYIFYAGRFYYHQLPAVQELLKALKELPDLMLRIRSLGPQKIEQEIDSYAALLGIKERILLLPPCTADQVLKEAAGAITNLVFEDLSTADPLGAGTLTGKFFELLPLKPPILVVARADSEMKTILMETGKGEVLNNHREIVCFLKQLKNEAPDEARVRMYSRQEQALILSRFLNRLMTGDL